MPKSKKKNPISELTNEDIAKRVFGKPLRDAIKKIARKEAKKVLKKRAKK
jgi:hypothetical protein